MNRQTSLIGWTDVQLYMPDLIWFDTSLVISLNHSPERYIDASFLHNDDGDDDDGDDDDSDDDDRNDIYDIGDDSRPPQLFSAFLDSHLFMI